MSNIQGGQTLTTSEAAKMRFRSPPTTTTGLSVGVLSRVPYYYFPDAVGKAYEAELRALGCEAFSWRGFHHPASGIDFDGKMGLIS
jgi:hypothetical protein